MKILFPLAVSAFTGLMVITQPALTEELSAMIQDKEQMELQQRIMDGSEKNQEQVQSQYQYQYRHQSQYQHQNQYDKGVASVNAANGQQGGGSKGR